MLGTANKLTVRPRSALLLIVLSSLAGCGSLPAISTESTYCCGAAAEQAPFFRIEFENMPEFLKPMLRDEASIALDKKGFGYTEGDAQAVLRMAFVATPVRANPVPDTAAWESVGAADGSHFVAEVVLELRNTASRELIWAGRMTRLHNVYEGSYMHEAPARSAMRLAFASLFQGLPDPAH